MNATARVAAVALAAALQAGAAQAGRNCEQVRPPAAASVQRAMTLAQKVSEQLSGSPAQVVVIARMGQDLSEYGQHYSHIGLAFRAGDHWRVVHKLNGCGSAQASVYRQGLGEFFLDDLYKYEAGVVVPTPEVQARLLAVLQNNAQASRMHVRPYSMLAYPWAQTYQQSNQWAIETLAMSQEPSATDRVRAQAWLRLKGYQPGMLHLSAMKRLGARATAANIAFDDHPNGPRYAGRIETVTADSVLTWLERSGLGSRPITIR